MADVPPLRHFGGFVLAGGTAFVTDVSVLHVLDTWVGLSPFLARVPSIMVAMVVSFLINRTITFAVPGRPRADEFLRFAAVGWMSSALNYAVYAGVLVLRPGTWPGAATVIATAVAMITSYLGMRVAVFRKS